MRRGDVRDNVGTTSDSLLAGPAVPDTGGVTLDRDLSAEGASVTGVLGDFHLLDLLTERGTVTVRVALVSTSGLGGLSLSRLRPLNLLRCYRWPWWMRTGYRIYR